MVSSGGSLGFGVRWGWFDAGAVGLGWRPDSLAAFLSWQDWAGFDLGGQVGPALFSPPTPTPTAGQQQTS